MKKADRHGLDAVGFDGGFERRFERREIGRGADRAVIGDAFADLEAEVAWHQRRGKPDAQIEQVVAPLKSDIERVAKTGGDQHRGRRAPPLDERVGDECGPVDQRRDLGDGDAGLGGQCTNPLDHRLRRIVRRGQPLMGHDLAGGVVEQGEIGERAADIDADAVALVCRHGVAPSPPAAISAQAATACATSASVMPR